MGFSQTFHGNGVVTSSGRGLTASHADLPFGTRIRITNLSNDKEVITTINGRIASDPDRLVEVSPAAAANIGMSISEPTEVRIEVISSPRVVNAEPPSDPPTPEPEPVAAAPAPVPEAPAPVPEAPVPVAAVPAPQVNISPAQYTVYINIEGLDKVIEQKGTLNPTGPTEIIVPVTPPARSTPRPAAAHTDTRQTRIQIGAYASRINVQDTVNKLRLAGFTPFSESYGNLTRVYITTASSDVSAAIRRLANAGFKDPWVRD
jgi:cell division protein FtsN